MASFIVFAIILGTVGLVLLLSKIMGKFSAGKNAPLGVSIQKNKYDIRLIAPTQTQMSLLISKPRKYARLLESISLFRQEKTGDAEFDALFQMTAYRDDVSNVIKTNAALRRSIIQLANAVPAFSSLIYGKERISLVLKLGNMAKEDAQESARTLLAAALPDLTSPFEKLPADTAKEINARVIDVGLPFLPVFTIFFLTIFGVFFDQPLVTGEVPWKYILGTSVLLIALHFIILLCLTKSGAVRTQGLFMAVIVFIFGTFNFVPGLVDEINGASSQVTTTETVEFAGLYKVTPNRRPARYYIVLASAPEKLVAGSVNSAPALEVSSTLYFSLENQHPLQNSPMEISEARGLLGLPFVVGAKPS